MRQLINFAMVVSGVLLMTSHSAAAQQQETLRLSKALYFDCSISSDQEPAKVYKLDVSYLTYADKPGPQINFFDTSKLISEQTGWARKGHFALSRIASDGQLFIWLGRSGETSSPQVDSTIELTPKTNDATRAAMILTRFKEGDAGTVSVQRFQGDCGTLSGKAAWDRYQNGGRS